MFVIVRSFDNVPQYVNCGQRQPPLSDAPVNKMAVNYHEGETDPSGSKRILLDPESGEIPHLFGTFCPRYRQCLTGLSQ